MRVAQWVKSTLLFTALWASGLWLAYAHDYVFCYESLSCSISPSESVLSGLPFLTVEVIVLYALLRPVSFNLSWGRALLAWATFAAWFWFLLSGVMHSPGWYIANLFWVGMVLLALSVLVVITGGSAVIRRLRHGRSGT